ncbi:hypothetical protein NB636_02045 [Oxalobacter aliiformigenes]|uniref:hypothetical protein n=1 Tax=Oxalobacter aliiformigenes TaxID=2946593 RepID=UPI0022AF509E|nr:hypothetical protein [Oxalobacter aliiformigenes]MCZ4065456.1 hypothetical protein [Oxalobacter aliiformigenes]WAV99669.1 hypothetical protein NB636_02045 [Oxalobacter aliiformigenes]
MATITFNKFDLGIDHRKGAAVSDANRLVEMKNAHVTTGLATEKRPGLKKVATLEAGTKGLFPAFGKLHTFYGGDGTITHADELFEAHKLVCAEEVTDDENSETSYAAVHKAVTSIHYVDVFNGYLYVAAEHGEEGFHHYLSGEEITQITDSQCPHTAAVLKAASKMFAVSPDGQTVRFSKTGDPTDWSAEEDAGFLPTGLNSRGAREAKALGIYQSNLVVLSRDGAQVWAIDPDPTAMSMTELVENVGSSFPQSLATVSGDLYFLSDYGFRSITTMQLVSKLSDVDIGSPIDDLVRPAIRNRTDMPKATYFYGTGKYMCAIDKQVFVYSVSRTAKIAAWSRYELPVGVDAWAELEGELYLRSGNDVYLLDEDGYTDDGQEYEVLIQIPWMNFKSPGVLKHMYGIDLAMEGECYVSVGMDARHSGSFTDEVRIVGNTYGGGLIPLECCGTEFSFRFRNVTDQPFRLDALTVYYNALGVL